MKRRGRIGVLLLALAAAVALIGTCVERPSAEDGGNSPGDSAGPSLEGPRSDPAMAAPARVPVVSTERAAARLDEAATVLVAEDRSSGEVLACSVTVAPTCPEPTTQVAAKRTVAMEHGVPVLGEDARAWVQADGYVPFCLTPSVLQSLSHGSDANRRVVQMWPASGLSIVVQSRDGTPIPGACAWLRRLDRRQFDPDGEVVRDIIRRFPDQRILIQILGRPGNPVDLDWLGISNVHGAIEVPTWPAEFGAVVQVTHPGFLATHHSLDPAPAGELAQTTIVLDRPVWAKVRVVDCDGDGVPGAEVRLTQGAREPIEVTTNRRGHARARELVPGSCMAEVLSPTYAASAVDLGEGTTIELVTRCTSHTRVSVAPQHRHLKKRVTHWEVRTSCGSTQRLDAPAGDPVDVQVADGPFTVLALNRSGDTLGTATHTAPVERVEVPLLALQASFHVRLVDFPEWPDSIELRQVSRADPWRTREAPWLVGTRTEDEGRYSVEGMLAGDLGCVLRLPDQSVAYHPQAPHGEVMSVAADEFGHGSLIAKRGEGRDPATVALRSPLWGQREPTLEELERGIELAPGPWIATQTHSTGNQIASLHHVVAHGEEVLPDARAGSDSSVRVRVTDAGQPAAGVMVQIVRTDDARDLLGSGKPRLRSTDEQGTATFLDVEPGEYHIHAWGVDVIRKSTCPLAYPGHGEVELTLALPSSAGGLPVLDASGEPCLITRAERFHASCDLHEFCRVGPDSHVYMDDPRPGEVVLVEAYARDALSQMRRRGYALAEVESNGSTLRLGTGVVTLGTALVERHADYRLEVETIGDCAIANLRIAPEAPLALFATEDGGFEWRGLVPSARVRLVDRSSGETILVRRAADIIGGVLTR